MNNKRTSDPKVWTTKPRDQYPNWSDQGEVEAIVNKIKKLPPLVFAGEIRSLNEKLAEVEAGKGFLLQAGDCAETFAECNAPVIREKLKVVLQMAVILTYSARVEVVKVGRIAGQYAKPRSSESETIDGITLPSYKGDLINSFGFDEPSRTPDPKRLLEGYYNAVATLNLIRAYTKGGFAGLDKVHNWNQEFVARSPIGERYEKLAVEIENAIAFIKSCGMNFENTRSLNEVDFFTSHEALVLEYEQSLTREDSLTGKIYDCSAHTVWLGDRTRRLDGAHVAYLQQIENPIGVKVGPTAEPDEVIEIVKSLNPQQIPGKLTLINRVGRDKPTSLITERIKAVQNAGLSTIWACDPMHGNTYSTSTGKKTRDFNDILQEVKNFFQACKDADAFPGGIHVELTGENVTECVGGGFDVTDNELNSRYETLCDPRLNASQSLDLAFEVAGLLKTMQE